MKLKTILVGVGGRGRWAVEVLGADPRFQPVALVDPNEMFLRSAQADLGLPDAALFPDLGRALEAVEADAVVLCTRPPAPTRRSRKSPFGPANMSSSRKA